MSDGPPNESRILPSLRSARESIRWLIKTGGVQVANDGLHIVRDPRNERMLLSVDDVLDRFTVLEVPDESITIALVRAANGKAHFDIRVNNAGTDHLAATYPVINELRQAIGNSS